VEDPEAPTFVAERKGEVIGYTSGVVSMRDMRRRFMARHGIMATVAASPRVVRPRVIRRAYELFRYPDTTQGFPDAELTFIAKKPDAPPGLGLALTRELLDSLVDRGVDEVKCYVGAANLKAQSVFRRAGFERRAQIIVHDGQPSFIYVYRCPSS
jgi:ribosomal protein S18 acetylase RimI-like enzyme